MKYEVAPAQSALTTKSLAVAFISLLALLLAVPAVYGQSFHTLYNFSNAYGRPDNLVMAPNGALIGSARGPDAYYLHPHSVVFSYSPQHTMSVLTQFWAPLGYAPQQPGGYVLSSDGSVILGYTESGGIENQNCLTYTGCGTVFSVPFGGGRHTFLHKFKGRDGENPLGNLVLDAGGNLYGITLLDGPSSNGVVFEISASGVESTLHAFLGAPDGAAPAAGLVRDSAGNLYGITLFGGKGPCNLGPSQGCGTVFKVDPSGNESVVYSFQGAADGAYPYYLAVDSSGNLYGLAFDQNFNTTQDVFEIDSAGNFSILYNGSFTPQITSIIAGPNGTFYGTAAFAGLSRKACFGTCGQIFQLTPTGGGTGTITTLHSFHGGDGFQPSDLVLSNGVLYGATWWGGANSKGTLGNGTLFKLKP